MSSQTPSRPGRGRRLALAAVVAAVGAGAAIVAFAPAEAVTPTARPAASALQWGSCPTGAPAPQQCATLRVPLDYRQPRGRTIALEVSRIPATDPARRRGVLLTNGGGPSASLDVPTALGGLLPAEVR